MLPSKKFLSLSIISLKEGQQIGFVRNLVIDPKTKAVAAFVVDPKGIFKDQRIIPFNRVTSIGKNAITVSTQTQVEKAVNLPNILELLKEKTAVIGMKVLTTGGKTLGKVQEFYIDPVSGKITCLDISDGKIEGLFSGKARLQAEDILTMGSDVIVVAEESEEKMDIASKGLNENLKSFFQTASAKASDKKQRINEYWKTKKRKSSEDYPEDIFEQDPTLEDLQQVQQVQISSDDEQVESETSKESTS
ncbi:MAG: photosystem reaction center subunit H [Peptococcaceae bacterium]|nr:photosystem reaction center subunit H [Peptococcaceae bacterium]